MNVPTQVSVDGDAWVTSMMRGRLPGWLQGNLHGCLFFQVPLGVSSKTLFVTGGHGASDLLTAAQKLLDSP